MKKSKSIIFFGTPDFSKIILQHLIDSNIDIKLVVTGEDKKKGRGKKILPTPVKELALEHNIDVITPTDVNTDEFVRMIKNMDADFNVVVAYGKIFKEPILNSSKYGSINIHSSILPEYRGAAPINWAIIDGKKESGITTMQMDTGLDTGDILLTSKINIDNSMNAGILHDILADLGGNLIIKTINNYDNIERISQDDKMHTYARKITKEDRKINFNNKAKDIHNLIRGLTPFPGAYVEYENNIIIFTETSVTDIISNNKPGYIQNVSKKYIDICTNDYLLRVHRIKPSGKKEMDIGSYILGNPINIGNCFS